MNNLIGYLNYKNEENKNIFKKLINKIFFKIEINVIENNKIELLINSFNINEKKFNKIKKVIKNKNINIIAISDNINIEKSYFKKENIKYFNGKFVMKYLIIQILELIYNYNNKNMIFDELYITINNDKNKDIILELATKFKYITIVTDKIKKLKRLQNKLENNEQIIFSITNNTKKSLRNAKIIVNFDYDENFFEKFNLNRNCVIINLNEENLKMKNSFQGVVIENIFFDYENKNYKYNNILEHKNKKDKYSNFEYENNKYINNLGCKSKKNKYKNIINYENKKTTNILNLKNFDKNILYESNIINMNYKEFKEYYKNNKCKIEHLIGSKGYILNAELKNIGLDKYNKKD